MIVSFKHKFIFIKTMKTAGTSFEMALREICGPNDVITPFYKEDEKVCQELGIPGPRNYFLGVSEYSIKDFIVLFLKNRRKKFFNHITSKEIKELLGDNDWKKFFKFCFERNPFDKVISHYYWEASKNPKIKNKSIYEFIKGGGLNNIKGFDRYTINKVVAVDKIYKYEDIDSSVQDFSEKIGLSDPIKLPKYKAKGQYRKNRAHYSKVLNEKEVDLISTIFAREIKLMDYSF